MPPVVGLMVSSQNSFLRMFSLAIGFLEAVLSTFEIGTQAKPIEGSSAVMRVGGVVALPTLISTFLAKLSGFTTNRLSSGGLLARGSALSIRSIAGSLFDSPESVAAIIAIVSSACRVNSFARLAIALAIGCVSFAITA